MGCGLGKAEKGGIWELSNFGQGLYVTWSSHEPLRENVMDPLEQRPSLLGFEGRSSWIRKTRLGKYLLPHP